MIEDPVIFASVCSGIEAASEAFLPLGMTCAFVSELDEQASAVLAHRYGCNMPDEPLSTNAPPNLGDFSAIDGQAWPQVEILIGGTPCQSFSLAGKRKSLEDARGNLALSFVELAHAINDVRRAGGKPGLIVAWENVPGVLSTKDNAFGCLLSGFVGCDTPVVSPLEQGRWPDEGLVAGPLARAAWRILDAQYFGLAQRRERVLVVVCFGDGDDPAEILFEPRGLRRDPPSRREARENAAGGAGDGASRDSGIPDVAGTLGSSQGGFKTTDLDQIGAYIPEVSKALSASPHLALREDRDTYIPEIAWALQERDAKGPDSSTKDGHLIIEPVPNLEAGGAIAFSSKDHGQDALEELSPTMRAMNFDKSHLNGGGQLAVMVNVSDGQPRISDISAPLDAARESRGSSQQRFVLEDRAVAFKPSHYTRDKDGAPSEVHPPLSADADKGDQEPIIFQSRIARNGRGQPSDVVPALNGSDAGETSDMRPLVATRYAVRRLMPHECERLQGFADGHTLVPWNGKQSSDSARYRQLGNSMPVPMIRWLGKRIKAAILKRRAAAEASS